ncbi:MAG: hypothetical protein FWF46_05305 [Oscillospiraceae bacterium]|nr:hypothetical protein [Oscillospiraceae bacterium]
MKKLIRKEKGITLIALIITVIVMLILAGVAIGALTGSNGLIGKVQSSANKYNAAAYKEQLDTDIIDAQMQFWQANSNASTPTDLTSVLEEKGYAVTDNGDGTITVEKDGGTAVINSDFTTTVEGVATNTTTNTTTNQQETNTDTGVNNIVTPPVTPPTVNLGNADGSWNGTVDTPVLASGMTPVAWDASNNEITPTTEAEWYNYANNKWANAKTADGSYWVWIPRYEYKIDYTGVEQGVNTDITKAGKIDVRFISVNTKSGSSGYTTDSSGITRSSDGYIIHPAFTNNVNQGGWDSEISGIWVAKYEMSMEDNAGTNVNTSNETIGNVALSTAVKAVSKPGVIAWTYINIANCYENSLDYGNSISHSNYNSHLEKNSEWGAVAYLTHSQYGRNGIEVTTNNNSSLIIGGGAGEAYKTNTNQSSTGNTSGIYDLSGCTWEYVAGFNKAYSGIYYTDSSYLSESGTDFASTGGNSTKYATAYSNSTNTYYYATTITDFTNIGGVAVDVSHIGDGMHEVWISGEYRWFSDCSHFVSTYGGPFFERGGAAGIGASAGIFSSNVMYRLCYRRQQLSCGANSAVTLSNANW